MTLSTGMTAIAFAREMCGETHIYGFGNGSCGGQCYHYYDCDPTAAKSERPSQVSMWRSRSAVRHACPRASRLSWSTGLHKLQTQAQAGVSQRLVGRVWHVERCCMLGGRCMWGGALHVGVRSFESVQPWGVKRGIA